MGIIKTALNNRGNENNRFYLVSYAEFQNLKLKEIFLRNISTIEIKDYFLHCEYGSLSLNEAISVQNELEEIEFEKNLNHDEIIIWQPDTATIRKLSFIEANNKLLKYMEKEINTNSIAQENMTKVMGMQSYLLDRYWAFLLFAGNTIPPGTSYLLDHYSQEIISKRYIDVKETLQKAGYSYPVASAQQRIQWNQEMGIDMAKFLPEGTEYCDLCSRVIKVHQNYK